MHLYINKYISFPVAGTKYPTPTTERRCFIGLLVSEDSVHCLLAQARNIMVERLGGEKLFTSCCPKSRAQERVPVKINPSQ